MYLYLFSRDTLEVYIPDRLAVVAHDETNNSISTA